MYVLINEYKNNIVKRFEKNKLEENIIKSKKINDYYESVDFYGKYSIYNNESGDRVFGSYPLNLN